MERTSHIPANAASNPTARLPTMIPDSVAFAAFSALADMRFSLGQLMLAKGFQMFQQGFTGLIKPRGRIRAFHQRIAWPPFPH